MRRVTEEMFLAAARALTGKVSEDDPASVSVFPELTRYQRSAEGASWLLGPLSDMMQLMTEARRGP